MVIDHFFIQSLYILKVINSEKVTKIISKIYLETLIFQSLYIV